MTATDAAPLHLVVADDEAGRVDRLLARRYPGASRALLDALLDDGAVRHGGPSGRRARKGDRVAAGAALTLLRAPATIADLRPVPDPEAAAALVVLHADAELVAVAKPAGMPTLPLRPGERGTAAGGLAHLFAECAALGDDPRDGGLVHRLDAGTSGVLVGARTRAAWQRLRRAFAEGRVDKRYLALVAHAPVAAECDLPLRQRGRRAAVDLAEGLDAHTTWEEIARHGAWRLLRCHARTGRTHQVRAHLAHCGAPIVGDALYGGPPCPALTGFFLHAESLRLPRDGGAPLTIEAPLPADRRAALAAAPG